MSAAELRQAAETLRLRAEAATPGPWVVEREEHSDHGGADSYWHITDEASNNYVSEVDRGVDAAYIATVNPSVGLMLAEFLESSAADVEAGWVLPRAEALARLINGTPS